MKKKKVFMDNYLIEKSQIPIIYYNDPLSRFYHLNVGNIIRIKRNYDNDFFYRIVCDN